MRLSLPPAACIRIAVTARARHRARLRFGPHHARCAIGEAGVTHDKKEGDKKTPLGQFALRRIWYRPDRVSVPQTALPIRKISRKSGWCDAPDHSAYNRPVRRPFAASHERLWRRDGLYDLFIELGINDAPVKPGCGSALFLHLQKTPLQPTLGCVAVGRDTMAFLVAHAHLGTKIEIVESG